MNEMSKLMLSDEEQTNKSPMLTPVGPLSILAPDTSWNGAISIADNNALTDAQDNKYFLLLKDAITLINRGGQRRCIDGRPSEKLIAPGPMTAGGDIGDAMRLMLASHAMQPERGMSFNEALARIMAIDEKYGFAPGGHDLGQCGAFAHGAYGIRAIAQAPASIAGATQTFLGAVEHEYSEDVQQRLADTAQQLVPKLESIVPSREEAAQELEVRYPGALPHLAGDHKERELVIFLRDDVTLDTNLLARSTKQELNEEWQAFGYNWNYHLLVANELGGELGQYYLQSVSSQDAGVLTQLTDGSLRITTVK